MITAVCLQLVLVHEAWENKSGPFSYSSITVSWFRSKYPIFLAHLLEMQEFNLKGFFSSIVNLFNDRAVSHINVNIRLSE